MKIHLGCDHAGFELKEKVATHLKNKGHEVIDHGAKTYDALDDYPVFCFLASQAAGEQIAANKIKGVRAALAWSPETAKLAREHNNANVMGIGGRMHSESESLAIVDAFVNTDFSNDERHIRRINQISEYETSGKMPPLPN
jgi:ribose 5-phosphate isomerase B